MTDETIIQRIRNLRAKATDAATSEAEAIACAKKAAKLLEEHDLSEADLSETTHERRADSLQVNVRCDSRGKPPYLVAILTGAIADYTQTRAFLAQGGVLVYGTEADTEMAAYLIEMTLYAHDQAWIKFRTEAAWIPGQSKAQRANGFTIGFAIAVADTLEELKTAREAAQAATGTALVVSKGEAIDAAIADDGLADAKTHNPRKRKVSREAYDAGRAAGAEVNVNRPLEARA